MISQQNLREMEPDRLSPSFTSVNGRKDGYSIAAVHDSIRRHQSVGRSFVYAVMGDRDVEVSADGSWVSVASGKRYLDWGGYGVFLLGHRHPKVVAAVKAQLEQMPGSTRAFPHEPIANFHREMSQLVPPHIVKFMLLNSGSEAVEAALKLARVTTGRTLVAHLEKSYHGKTLGALAVTDAAIFRKPFADVVPPAATLSRSDPELTATAITRLAPAAVIIEPIQGEGGIYPLSVDVIRAVREACTQTGALMISDEIQCGLGRSGETWGFMPSGIEPDIILAGKALGGGVMPVSAVMATAAAFTPFDRDPILHSSTFGGNPLAAAAASEAARVIRIDRIPEKCAALGRSFAVFLESLTSDHSGLLGGWSGRGLLTGLHFRTPEGAGTFLQQAFRHNLLVTPCLTTPHVVRISPPATMTAEELQFGFERLASAMAGTEKELC